MRQGSPRALNNTYQKRATVVIFSSYDSKSIQETLIKPIENAKLSSKLGVKA